MNEPSKTFEFDKIFRGLGSAVELYDDVLHRMGFGQHIDEIAYMLPSYSLATTFIREGVQEDGCVHFNTATDHVHTSPIASHYDVMYDFLTVPLKYVHRGEVRIEAMTMIDGFSPLHFAEALNMDRDGMASSAIHASFKCQDESDYGTAIHVLKEMGWECAQRCRSTYGRFSYWRPLDLDKWLPDGPYLYLKPRVNLRDAEGGA